MAHAPFGFAVHSESAVQVGPPIPPASMAHAGWAGRGNFEGHCFGARRRSVPPAHVSTPVSIPSMTTGVGSTHLNGNALASFAASTPPSFEG